MQTELAQKLDAVISRRFKGEKGVLADVKMAFCKYWDTEEAEIETVEDRIVFFTPGESEFEFIIEPGSLRVIEYNYNFALVKQFDKTFKDFVDFDSHNLSFC